jgi:hypothetical protein
VFALRLELQALLMTRSIELTLDPTTDAAIRADWTALADAGLPSLANNPSPSNRPHITLAAGDDLEFSGTVPGLPLDLEFAGLLLFPAPRNRFVLVRAVVLSATLAEVHRAVHERVSGAVPNSLPGRFTPHVTLARRVAADQLPAVLEVLGDIRTLRVSGARFWDSASATVTPL